MQKRRIYVLELFFLSLLAALFAWGTALERQQQALSDHLIRLHVVANSDGALDQQQKLIVRDAVLLEASDILDGTFDRESAYARLDQHLPALCQAANRALTGTGQEAKVSLQRELFRTRNYDSFSLPGGYYDTLRVTIGAGQGHNWWCVVYPQVCTAATSEEFRTVAAMGGLSREEIGLMTGQTPEYQLRFRSIELLEDVLSWFREKRTGGFR